MDPPNAPPLLLLAIRAPNGTETPGAAVGGLSTAAQAGIGVGVAVVFVLLLAQLLYILRRR